jgi:hypothetical protein
LSGSSPALHGAIFKALALMPGVRALGETTTHTGATGLGFDAPVNSPTANIAIVVDPQTGALLEARNLGIDLGTDPLSLGSFTTPAFPASQNYSGQFVTQWMDPSTSAQVVDSTSLPSELHPSPAPTALLTATVEPGSSSEQISALYQQMAQQFGDLDFTFGGEATTTMTFGYNGPASGVQAVADALRSSPIVVSVTVDNGDE